MIYLKERIKDKIRVWINLLSEVNGNKILNLIHPLSTLTQYKTKLKNKDWKLIIIEWTRVIISWNE
jgi:hypothetical protein